MKRFALPLIAAILAVSAATRLAAAGFTVGNLVLVRVGTGASALTNTGNAVFLDEYSPAGVLVQSIALPVAPGGANRPLILDGTAGSEGALTRSTDGRYVVLTGYGVAPGGGASLGTSAAAAVNRVVARIDGAGIVNTATALADFADGASARGAASVDGSTFWLVGGNGGVRHAAFGAATSLEISSTVADLRAAELCVGQLYVSSISGALRIGTVGTGLPTTGGQTTANLPGFPTTGSPHGFFLVDLDAGVAGADTLYVADDGGTIQKFSLVGGVWTANGSVAAAGVRGLTSAVSGATVTLYATSGTTLYRFADATGYNGAISGSATAIASAAASTALRGVAIVPVAAPSITAHPATQTANTGDTVTFTVAATGSEALTYRWRRGGVNLSDVAGSISGATTPTLTLTNVTTASAGTYDVVVTNPVNPVTSNGVALTVNAAPPPPPPPPPPSDPGVVITLGNLNQRYDGTPRVITTTTIPPATVTVTYNGSPTPPINAGVYTVMATVDQPLSGRLVVGVLVVSKIAQTITFAGPPASPFVSVPFTLSATASSGLPVTVAVVSGNASLFGDRLTLNDTSPVTVRAIQEGDANRESATAETTLVATKQDQTIAFAGPAHMTAPAAPFTLSATASSALPVNFELVSGPASVIGNSIALTGISGAVVVRAVQSGNAAFNPAPPVERSFNVTQIGFAGSYFGTLGNGGPFGLLIGGNQPGVFLGFTPATRTGYISRAISVDAAGRFRFTATTLDFPLTPLPNYSPAAPPVAAAVDDLVVEGTIAPDGTVTGASISGSSFTLRGSRSPDSGATPAVMGLYQAGMVNSAAQILIMTGSDRQALVLVQNGGVVDGGIGNVDAIGRLSVITAGQQNVTGVISTQTSAFNATVASAGAASVAFAGFGAGSAGGNAQRVSNLSTRTTLAAGDQVAIVGFVLAGGNTRTVLIRAVGPTLRNFGVVAAAAAPRLDLVRSGSPGTIASNTGWTTAPNSAEMSAAATRSGAFPLNAGSADSVILTSLAAGAYTALVSASAGVVLVEVYDLSDPTSPQRLANVSTRAATATGEDILIAGVVVRGTAPKRILIRAAGPSLAQFGVPGVLARPQLTLYSGTTVIATNTGWNTSVDNAAIAEAAARTGAFAFAPASADAALVLSLAPGAYTAQVTGVGGTTGIALIEVYEVP